MSTERVRSGQVPAALKRVRKRAIRAVDRAMKVSASFGAKRIQNNISRTTPFAPIDTRAMVKSVRKLRLKVTPNRRGYKIVTSPRYAVYMESGSKPHRPPWSPIFAWAQRKTGGNRRQAGALAVYARQRLSERGHTARKFGAKAVRPIKTMLNGQIRSHLRVEFS